MRTRSLIRSSSQESAPQKPPQDNPGAMEPSAAKHTIDGSHDDTTELDNGSISTDATQEVFDSLSGRIDHHTRPHTANSNCITIKADSQEPRQQDESFDSDKTSARVFPAEALPLSTGNHGTNVAQQAQAEGNRNGIHYRFLEHKRTNGSRLERL